MAALKGGQRRALPEDLENVEFETSEDVEVTPTFDGMGLREVGRSRSRRLVAFMEMDVIFAVCRKIKADYIISIF